MMTALLGCLRSLTDLFWAGLPTSHVLQHLHCLLNPKQCRPPGV